MSKIKTAFFCQNCGHEAPKWLGKCPSCSEWNTFVEELKDTSSKSSIVAFSTSTKKAVPHILQEIKSQDFPRMVFSDKEVNRVLGGGLVPGSLILFGGEPGIGKSHVSENAYSRYTRGCEI